MKTVITTQFSVITLTAEDYPSISIDIVNTGILVIKTPDGKPVLTASPPYQVTY